jgi:hypothetical protein
MKKEGMAFGSPVGLLDGMDVITELKFRERAPQGM